MYAKNIHTNITINIHTVYKLLFQTLIYMSVCVNKNVMAITNEVVNNVIF